MSLIINMFLDLTTRNASWYADAASGFMLDPGSFLLEDQTEQRNKNVSKFIKNNICNYLIKQIIGLNRTGLLLIQ
jgi:hypothetical protein